MKPVLVDLFSGAGGAAKGYQRAGFFVIGVDKHPQPNYCGDRFYQEDAIEFLEHLLDWYGNNEPGPVRAIHASPPCQRDSAMSNCRPGLAKSYPALIEPTREILMMSGLPWVIENVPGSPLKNPMELCGHMFDLPLYRHRLFESNWPIAVPEHPEHITPASRAGHWKSGTIISVAGHIAPIALAREAMGIDWTTREELAEAIPPAYPEHIGKQLMEHINGT